MHTKLIISLALVCFSCHAACMQVKTREFQQVLDLNRFSSREDLINTYVGTWAQAAETSLNNFTRADSVREESSFRDISNCGSQDYIRKRVYTDGDLEGLVTVDIKSVGSLSREEAEAEEFAPSEEYEGQAIEYIEYDIHTCYADYAANTRVFLTSKNPEFETCSDIYDFFPEAVADRDIPLNGEGNIEVFTFTSFWEAVYLDGEVTLDITINYDSFDDARTGTNPKNGEFSFTMIASNDNQFSEEQTEMGIQIYEFLLEQLGSPGEEYPCEDGTTISDLFVITYESSESSVATSIETASNFDDDGSSGASNIAVSVIVVFVGVVFAVVV